MTIVYIALSADLLHPGHLNIISEGRKLCNKPEDRLIIGLLTDRAVASFKRMPYMTWDQRKIVVENVKGVTDVVPQDSSDYSENLRRYRPDYLLHGDDWLQGVLAPIREKARAVMQEWGGQIVDIPYTQGLDGTALDEVTRQLGAAAEIRCGRLRRLLGGKELISVCEAHDGLSGMIVEQTAVLGQDGSRHEFDGIWISSLTQSAAKGKPDNGYLGVSGRLAELNDILEVTSKPIIFDADSGGPAEHFAHTVKTLERLGVSAVIIEDKVGLKKNSLFGTDVIQSQDSIASFCDKLKVGRQALGHSDFMIIARIESLILGKGQEDALSRAQAYLEAGADGIMIHSRSSTVEEVRDFCLEYAKFPQRRPLVVVPSSYDTVREHELKDLGVNIVIYANQLLRAAYPAMRRCAESILREGRAHEATTQYCMGIKDIITLIPGGR